MKIIGLIILIIVANIVWFTAQIAWGVFNEKEQDISEGGEFDD